MCIRRGKRKKNESMNSPIISLPRFIGGIQSDLNNVETTFSLTSTKGYYPKVSSLRFTDSLKRIPLVYDVRFSPRLSSRSTLLPN